MNEPDATHFRVGDRWLSPWGQEFVVVKRKGQQVALNRKVSPRQSWRIWDDIGAHSNRPWTRISWGGQE